MGGPLRCCRLRAGLLLLSANRLLALLLACDMGDGDAAPAPVAGKYRDMRATHSPLQVAASLHVQPHIRREEGGEHGKVIFSRRLKSFYLGHSITFQNLDADSETWPRLLQPGASPKQ